MLSPNDLRNKWVHVQPVQLGRPWFMSASEHEIVHLQKDINEWIYIQAIHCSSRPIFRHGTGPKATAPVQHESIHRR